MRNLKIGVKLFLGFVLLLCVFVCAVAMTWLKLNVIRAGTQELSSIGVQIMRMSVQANQDIYELFLAARIMQSKESGESIEQVRAKMQGAADSMEQLAASAREYAHLQSSNYILENLAPNFKTYTGLIEKIIPFITEKTAIYNEIQQIGDDVASLAIQIERTIIQSAQAAQILGGPGISLETISQSGELTFTIEGSRRALEKAVATSDEKDVKALIDFIEPIEKRLATLQDSLNISAAQFMLDFLSDSIKDYTSDLTTFAKAHEELQSLYHQCEPVLQALNNDSTYISTITQNHAESISKDAVKGADSSVVLLFASTAVAVAAGIFIAYWISWSITKPLKTIVEIAKRAEEGDLTTERKDFGYESKDELGTLVAALSNMITAQADTMQEVVTVADNLTKGAVNLSTISEETNASMEEIKATIDQIAVLSDRNGATLKQCDSEVEVMSADADSVAQSATDSASFIAQTANASNKAIQTVSKVIAGMHDADKNAKISEDKIRHLVTSVDNVSSFVSVITGIADQTNLLALNAAIEAARAGEVGRGFAVVAEEVRKLAEESASAAQNINRIIVDLQSEAKDSIKATTDADQMLADTLTQAEQAQKELDIALNGINKANESIQNIAAVAEEQAASSKNVASAIDSATNAMMEMVDAISGIKNSADDTASTAQGVAEQSSKMTENAQTLATVLSHFKLRAAKAPALRK